MSEYKMCPNEDMAIYILDFIKRGYENRYQDHGVKKYIEALEMGIEALKERKEKNNNTESVIKVEDEQEYICEEVYGKQTTTDGKVSWYGTITGPHIDEI